MKILLYLLLSHLMADFILQSDQLVAEKDCFYGHAHKRVSLKNPLLKHGVVIFSVMQLLHLYYKPWLSIVGMTLLLTIGHILIDHFKLTHQSKLNKLKPLVFTMDQVAHLIVLYVVSGWFHLVDERKYLRVFGSYITSSNRGRWWVPELSADYLSILIVLILFSFVAGQIISFMLENLKVVKREEKTTEGETGTQDVRHLSDSEKKIGIKIGIIERVLVIIFVATWQFGAMGLILAGKSLARYEELKDKAFSEYYLYGTLISFLFAIVGGLIIKVAFL